MKRYWAVILLLLLGLLGCQQEAPVIIPAGPTVTPPPLILRLGITSSAAPFADLITAESWPHEAAARVQFIPGNTATLYDDLAQGNLDGIFVHRVPPEFDGYFTPVAVDGLVILVPPDSPVTELTMAQVRALFSGQISNWSVLTGTDMPVQPLSRARGSGNREIFQQRVMVELPVTINAPVPATYELLLSELAATPGGISYGMMGAVGANRPVTIAGIAATTATVTQQRYPLTVPLYFVSLAEPAGTPETTTAATAELRAYVAWLQSPAGQRLISARYGTVAPIVP